MGCCGSKIDEQPVFPLPDDVFPKDGVKEVPKVAFSARTEKHTVIGMGANLFKSTLGSEGGVSGIRFIDLEAGKPLAYGVNNATGANRNWDGYWGTGGPKLLLIDADEKPVLVIYAPLKKLRSAQTRIYAFDPLFTDQKPSGTKYKGGPLFLVAKVQIKFSKAGLEKAAGLCFAVMMATGKSKTEKNSLKEASMRVCSLHKPLKKFGLKMNLQQWIVKTGQGDEEEVAIRDARTHCSGPVRSVLSAARGRGRTTCVACAQVVMLFQTACNVPPKDKESVKMKMAKQAAKAAGKGIYTL